MMIIYYIPSFWYEFFCELKDGDWPCEIPPDNLFIVAHTCDR